jgi:hypothetical protein
MRIPAGMRLDHPHTVLFRRSTGVRRMEVATGGPGKDRGRPLMVAVYVPRTKVRMFEKDFKADSQGGARR